MSWEKEYEHLRDRGRTWGPGVDDVEEPSAEEIARRQVQRDAYRQKLEAYSVEPRKEFADAGEALKAEPAPSSVDGGALLAWQRKYNDAALALCKSAAKSLGYSLELGWPKNLREQTKSKETFSVSVEYHGWLPGAGGNIHKFFVSGIEDVEDCLQLVADFGAVGQWSTTWYGENFHYSTRNTGELRNELIRRFGIGEPKVPDCDAPRINRDKLERYLAEEMILEFASAEECMEYFNTYDSQEFQFVEEMKAYQGEYGFGIDGKWYHVNFQEALDVWENASLEETIDKATERSAKTDGGASKNDVDLYKG